jgi:S-adenosylmethionine synthetase
MFDLVRSQLDNRDDVEVVERKGAGHPDTICDALAETLSRNLCREYVSRFGHVLHHNVDKALLCGGRAMPAFGGGKVSDPIRIFLAGRAVTNVGNETIPVEDIAIEGSRVWLKANLHALDVDRHVRVEALVHQGSRDLQLLFSRGAHSEFHLPTIRHSASATHRLALLKGSYSASSGDCTSATACMTIQLGAKTSRSWLSEAGSTSSSQSPAP